MRISGNSFKLAIYKRPAPGKKVVFINLNQLRNLHKSGIKIGRWTCREWYANLEKTFEAYTERVPGFDHHFKDLESYLLYEPKPEAMDDRYSVDYERLGFCMYFIAFFTKINRERFGVKTAAVQGLQDIFMTLIAESVRLRHNQSNLEKVDSILQEVSKDVPTLDPELKMVA